MVLADTSVWVNHFRGRDNLLVGALERGEILMHPFVLGELACGNLKNRHELLGLLSGLPSAPVATDYETLQFIERHRLMGAGLGYIDVHLLASTTLGAPAGLWTTDRRLAEAARKLKIAVER
jgi:predicted nucleic acid-binding protein